MFTLAQTHDGRGPNRDVAFALGWVMQQSTSQQLYAYWDRARNGRVAPCRFEIEPAAIAPLLSETFIAECTGPFRYRFRLAGTRICECFGQELRGADVASLWRPEDRPDIISLCSHVFGEGAVARAECRLANRLDRVCTMELLLLPLVLSGDVISRALGSLTVAAPPFWLGTEPAEPLQLVDHTLHWPESTQRPERPPQPTHGQLEALLRKQFTVYEGGLTKVEEQ